MSGFACGSLRPPRVAPAPLCPTLCPSLSALLSLQDDPRWHIADPICTFLFAVLVLWTTRAILR